VALIITGLYRYIDWSTELEKVLEILISLFFFTILITTLFILNFLRNVFYVSNSNGYHKYYCKILCAMFRKTILKRDVHSEGNFKVDKSMVQNGYLLNWMIPEVINGNFDCSGSKLINLFSVPHKIVGNFNCSHNDLKNLNYAPKKVYRDFSCNNNILNSLDGLQQEIHGNFSCRNNNLYSLEHVPILVRGRYDCARNNLKTLKGSPMKVEGDFDCSYNKLSSLEFLT
jgi:hypothetical protein